MLTQNATTWLEAVPVVMTGLVLVLAPGFVALRLLGVRGLAAWAIAPLLSVGAVAFSGVTASFVGIRWGVLPLFAGCLLMWLVAAALGWALRPVSEPLPEAGWPALVAVAVAAAGFGLVFLSVLDRPDVFPQQPDTSFHLGAAQWMLDRGDISTLHASGFASLSSGFYPAGFHGVAVTLSEILGAPVVVSSTVLALVAAAVIWPLGCVLLARLVLGPGLDVALAAGVVSIAFTAFPWWLTGYGVLWPNLLGYALLPAALATVVAIVRPAPVAVLGRGRALLVLVAGIPALFLAHPNAFIGLLVLGYLVVAERAAMLAWSMRRTRRRVAGATLGALLICTVAAVGVVAFFTWRATGMRASTPEGPERSLRAAVIEALLYAPREAPRLWILSALVVIGAGVLLVRKGGQRWVVAGIVVTSFLYVAVAGVDSPRTRLLTWPWYNNAPRLAALMVLPAVLAAAAALVAATDLLTRLSAPTPRREWLLAVIAPLVFVLATGGYVSQHREMIDRYFHPPPSSSWASDADLAALRALAPLIPAGDVVAANPWNGATYLYLVSGRRLLFPTEKALTVGDRMLLARRLDEVGTSPRVCAAARRQHVKYAIIGGTRAGVSPAFRRYPGVDAVAASPAFRQVGAAGSFQLFELILCAVD